MCLEEWPVWLDATGLDEIMRRPALTDERRATVVELASRVWRSPLRLTLATGPDSGVEVRVVALTACFGPSCVATSVVFGLAHVLRSRDAALRTLIRTYARTFDEDKWRRTRWFMTETGGELHELKLQSCAARRIWFLQEVAVSALDAGAPVPGNE